MNKKLNQQYFETKKQYKEEYGKQNPRKVALNTLIASMIILIPFFLLKSCEKKAPIKPNKEQVIEDTSKQITTNQFSYSNASIW